MVERLLVSEGTSSVEPRRSCECSPVVYELMVRLSAMEDADVPKREVSNEPCLLLMSGEENSDDWYVSGVVNAVWPSGRPSMPLEAAIMVGASLLSEDLVSEGALGSS